MKSEKGITMTALVIYIIVFMLILGIMATITNSFYTNIGLIKNAPSYAEEFNKFSMFFIQDVKKHNDVAAVSSSQLEFEDGTIYQYKEQKIYRNGVVLSKNVEKFSFTKSTIVVDAVTKNIIHVNAIIGKKEAQATRDIDFVLKYW